MCWVHGAVRYAGEGRVSSGCGRTSPAALTRLGPCGMTASRPVPPSLLLLLPLYGGLNVLAGFMGNKQGGFGPVAVELGLLAYIGAIDL